MSQDLWEQHTSARGTLRLQGHLGARDRIWGFIRDFSHSYLIYVYGSGGIGKTRLVKDILDYPPPEPDLLAAVNLVDLYHTRNHSLAGLVDAFLDVIPGFRDYFREQLAANEKWEKTARLEQEGLPLSEIVSLRRELTGFFLSTLNQFKGKRRLILALDTAEKLLLADQPIQQTLGIGDHIMPILEWLLDEFLPCVENAVVLLAGRPDKENKLVQRLGQIKQKRLELIELKGLNEQEATRYIDAIADAAMQGGDKHTADWIYGITPGQRKSIYENLSEYDQDNNRLGVRPIQLSLVIDNYVVSGRPPKEIMELPPGGTASSGRRKSFEEHLVNAFQDTPRPVNKILAWMALMPKGVDDGFLEKIDPNKEATTSLREIHDLSFVKLRPSDSRLFLHDEVYELLNKHLWRSPGRVATAGRIREMILQDYRERILKAKDHLAELYKGELALKSEKSIEHSGEKPKPSEIIEARATLQNLMVEHLHYSVEQDPEKGFDVYYQYAEEAILSNDESLDIQLRAELLAFLSRPENSKLISLKKRADADAAVRWVKRYVQEGNHESALELVQKLRTEHRDLLQKGGVLAGIELSVWEALAQTRLTDTARAAKTLNSVIAKLEGLPPSLQRDCVLARAYNNLGYLLRTEGKFYGADKIYKKALPFWRQIKMEVEQAYTLNNHAFVLSEIGNFEAAWAQAWDGLKLRERQGRLSSVIFSLNTLAHVRTQENSLDDSLHYAKLALDKAEQLQTPRARGLALIEAAEAYRRISEWDKFYPTQTADYLKLAIDSASRAQDIFSGSVTEPERLARALIELGCAYRDWARFLRNQPELGLEHEETQRLAGLAEDALKQAVEIAEREEMPPFRVDALVNLAMLHYYMNRPQVTETISQIYHPKKGIPPAYRAGKNAPGKLFKIKKEDAVLPFLTLLGKAHLVLGQVQFSQFKRHKTETFLNTAVENYTLSLAYFSVYGDSVPREMRRAQERIHKRIKTLNIEELKKVKTFVRAAERKYNLRSPSRMWQLLDERGLII